MVATHDRVTRNTTIFKFEIIAYVVLSIFQYFSICMAMHSNVDTLYKLLRSACNPPEAALRVGHL